MRFSARKTRFGRRRGMSSTGYVVILAFIVILLALGIGLARLTLSPGSSTNTSSSHTNSSHTNTSHTSSSTGSTQTKGELDVTVSSVNLVSNCYPNPTTQCVNDPSNSTVRGTLQFKIYNPNAVAGFLVSQPSSQYRAGAGINGPSWTSSAGACNFTTGTAVAPRSTTSFSCNLTEPNGVIWSGSTYTWFVDVDFTTYAPPGPNEFQQITSTISAVQA